MISLSVGIDPGSRRIGYGAVRSDTGEPVTCGSVPIAGEDGFDKAVRDAVLAVEVWVSIASDKAFGDPGEVAEVHVERPAGGRGGMQSTITLALAAGAIGHAAWRRWVHAIHHRPSPAAWKRACGLPGNCGIEPVYELATELGFDHGGDRDAAAGALIARAAWAEAERAAEAAEEGA